MAAASAHKKRFRSWQNLAPIQTRSLSSHLNKIVIPMVEAEGYKRVDVCLQEKDCPVSGREIRLERTSGDLIDSVTFAFDKYRDPRLQIYFSRREKKSPHEWIRSARLVSRRILFHHFWGKPWWLPRKFWSDRASARTVGRLARRTNQIFRFLDEADEGPNIRPQI